MKTGYMVKFIILISLLYFLPGTLYGEKPSFTNTLTIAAVQFAVHWSIYSSGDDFSRFIRNTVLKIIKNTTPDLIIFPEYTLVFLALIPFSNEINAAASSEEAFKKIAENNPDITSLKDIFITNSSFVKRTADDIFGSLSGEFHTYIIAGTYFAFSRGFIRNPGLYNRALVYNPSGKCCYTQDKVYLTEFEQTVIGLSGGKIIHAKGFSIRRWKIGMTICRDTYLPEWEKQFSRKDLWIDIKANGIYYDEQQESSFKRALPLRLKNTNVPYGVTLCLTGRIFELFWEGESSFIKKTETGIEYLKTSKTTTDMEILVMDLDSFSEDCE